MKFEYVGKQLVEWTWKTKETAKILTWMELPDDYEKGSCKYMLEWDQYVQIHKAYSREEDEEVEWLPDSLVTFINDWKLAIITPDMIKAKVGDEFWNKLKSYQKEGVLFTLARIAGAFIGDEMGVGKTLQGICVMKYYGGTSLVISTSTGGRNWKEEWIRFTDSPLDSVLLVLHKTDFDKYDAQKHKVLVISYALTRICGEELMKIPFETIVIDESHRVMNEKAAQTKVIHGICDRTPHKVLLSGTPINATQELWSQMRCIYPALYPLFFDASNTEPNFAWRYCKPVKKYIGRGRTIWETKGAKNTTELHQLIKEFVMIRRLSEDVNPELPILHRKRVGIVLPEETLAEFKREMKSIDDKKETKDGEAKGDFNKLWMATSEAKLPLMLEYIRDYITSEEFKVTPTLFFGFHYIVLDSLRDLLDHYKQQYIRIDGQTPSKDRGLLCTKFQTSDTINAAILNIVAAGESVNFTRGKKMIFLEYHPNPNWLLQCEKRIHRPGQKSEVYIEYLHTKGTFDDRMWNILQYKIRNASLVIDGRVRPMHALYCTLPPPDTGKRMDAGE